MALDLEPVDGTLTLRRYAGEYPAHQHAHSQVLVGLRGRLDLEVDGHSAFVDQACGLVVPAGAQHSYLVKGAASVLVIDCAAAPGTDRFRRFAALPGWRRSGQTLAASTVLAELDAASSVLPRRRLDVEAITRAIDAQLHRNWTVAALAQSSHLSPQRFRARFAELTGTSPLGYVRGRRLDRAERLIRSGLALDAVALQVGYGSASALSYALRRDRGIGVRELLGARAM